MPYPAGLVRANINANLGSGEIMVNTVWIRGDQAAGFDMLPLQGIADRVRDAWRGFIELGQGGALAQGAAFSTNTQWTKVSAYRVNALGKATEQAEALFPATTKGSQNTALPPQTALVVTTLTARPGRSGRGRFYLGGLSTAGLTAGGRHSVNSANAIALAMAQFYVAIRDQPNVGDAYRPVVVSPTPGDSFKIKSVAVGDVYDTMRSRRNKLVEAKSPSVVDAT